MNQADRHIDDTTDAPHTSVVVTLRPGALIVDLGSARRIVSTAPYGGGLTSSRYFANYTVSNNFCADDVAAAIGAMLSRDGLPANATTCALTAVDVARYETAHALEAG